MKPTLILQRMRRNTDEKKKSEERSMYARYSLNFEYTRHENSIYCVHYANQMK